MKEHLLSFPINLVYVFGCNFDKIELAYYGPIDCVCVCAILRKAEYKSRNTDWTAKQLLNGAYRFTLAVEMVCKVSSDLSYLRS